MTYGFAPRQAKGSFRNNAKGLATTAGATSLAFAAYLVLYQQSLSEQPAPVYREGRGSEDTARAPEPVFRASLKREDASQSSARAAGTAPGAVLARVHHATIAPVAHTQPIVSATAGGVEALPATVGGANALSSPETPREADGIPERTLLARLDNAPFSTPGNARLMADDAPRLAPDFSQLADETDGRPALIADLGAPAWPVIQVSATSGTVPDEVSPSETGTAAPVDASGSAVRQPAPERTAAAPAPAETASASEPVQPAGAASPLAAVPAAPSAGNRQLTERVRRLDSRIARQKAAAVPTEGRRLKSARLTADGAGLTPIAGTTGERLGGDISLQIRDGELVAVQLSELISLFEDRLDRPLFVWLKTSSNADKFVTPQTLARAGIRIAYDDATGKAVLSLTE
ncbi:hypothetical protein ACWPM1_13775 [Tsuneonella sp. HG249]